jgi:hypothetical protein
MRKRFWLLSLMATGACTNPDNDQARRRDTLTQRQRDSIVAESKLPGAGAVGAALRASDSMAKRTRAMDSVPR